MTVTAALGTATQGANTQGRKFSLISNNMANVDTVGYAKKETVFSTLVTGVSGSASASGGVRSIVINKIDQQGLIEFTDESTNVAISGQGFIPVQDDTGATFFTRAGNFTTNSRGELENPAGFLAMAWPLDNDGRKPGETGNTNTNPAESVSSLEKVDINAVSGTASATTTISLGMNLNANTNVYQGATMTVDLVSSNNSSGGQSSIIVPTNTSGESMQIGDLLTLQAGTNTAVDFDYGGFAKSKILSATSAVFGATNSDATFVAGTDLTDGDQFSINTTSLTSAVTFTYTTNSPNTASQQFNSLSTLATAIDSLSTLTARVVNNQLFVSSTDADDAITFTDLSNATIAQEVGFSNVAASSSGRRWNTIAGLSEQVSAQSDFDTTIVNPNSQTQLQIFTADPELGLTISKTENVVTINPTSSENGIIAETALIVPVENASEFVAENTAAIATGSTITFTEGTTLRGTAVYGGIAASSALTDTQIDTDLGATAGDITFNDGTNTLTLTYATDFDSVTELAALIDADADFRARVVNNILYVGPADPDLGLTITETTDVATTLGNELVVGSPITAYAGTGNRFSTLSDLSTDINAYTNFATSLTTGANASFTVTSSSSGTATQMTIGGDRNAGLLGDLGLQEGDVGDGFLEELGQVAVFDNTDETTDNSASIVASYASNTGSERNMASGAITPSFSRNIRIFDSLGTGHDFRMSFIKIGTNEWATELYAIDNDEISNGGTDGQVATGTITFNGDGSLASISGTIASAVTINWTNGATSNSVSFTLGTAGPPAATAGSITPGSTDGLRQFASPFNVEFVDNNGVEAGQFSNVTIDEDGYIVANFTNGETKQIYKIPIMIVEDPNSMSEVTGNVYQVTQASGEANLKDAGVGKAGIFVPRSVESSTADIAEELTETIPTQSNYNANLRVITAADEMLERLTNI